MAIIKKHTNTKCCQGREEKEPHTPAGGNVNLCAATVKKREGEN